jgi:site-specific DNA recombinase
MRTACYARYSSDLQSRTSIDDQIRSCAAYAARHGWIWQADYVYTDAALSGASIEGRPGVKALLDAAKALSRPFDIVLVDDSSRVARDLPDALRFLQNLKFEGVRVVYLSQGIDSVSETAETLVAVHGIVDGLYLREMASKIRRGLAGQLTRGYSTGGSTFGYRTVPVTDATGRLDSTGRPALVGKRLEIDPPKAAIVVRIFSAYAGGAGVPRIVAMLNADETPGPRGRKWKPGAVRRLLANERFTGKQIWGQRHFDRRPGTQQKIARPVKSTEWHTLDRPDLRIVSEALWQEVQIRRRDAGEVARQAGRGLMRGQNAALHSRHLFSGFLRCGVCHGAIAVVSGGHGQPRYGCIRRSKNGASACTNGLTVRASIADAALLGGTQAELLRPDTVQYLVGLVTQGLNAIIDERPKRRATLAVQRQDVVDRLANLVAAVEQGHALPSMFQAIQAREADIKRLDTELAALEPPLEGRLAVMPTWVRKQLEDVAGLLNTTPERAKAEFRRLGLMFSLAPVLDEGPRPFLRAEGSGNFEAMAFRQFNDFTTPVRSDPRSTP